jgi:hypothetical protein
MPTGYLGLGFWHDGLNPKWTSTGDATRLIAKALAGLSAKTAYLDDKLCGVLPDGRTAFNLIQNTMEHGDVSLVYFVPRVVVVRVPRVSVAAATPRVVLRSSLT